MITNDFNTKITPATVVGKQAAYVSIPVFGFIDSEWLGASRVIAIYNYSATNNFTIRDIDFTPLTSEQDRYFIVCIKYKTSDGDIVRYKLIDNSLGILYVPMYDGEIILKEFTIEIWSTNQTVDVFNNNEAITINLSILKARTSLDDDNTYENVVGVLCDDIYAAGASASPIQTNLISWYDANYGVTHIANRITQVLDRMGLRNLVPDGGAGNRPLLVTNATIANPLYRAGIQFDDVNRSLFNDGTGVVDYSAGTIFLLLKQVTWVDTRDILSLVNDVAAEILIINQSTLTPNIVVDNISVATLTSDTTLDNYYLLRITINSTELKLETNDFSEVLSDVTGAGVSTPCVNTRETYLSLAGSSANFIFIESLIYADYKSDADALLIKQYFNEKYDFGLPAPLIFSTCAIGNNNL